jgi:membrane-associated phospholipid phosphatase
MSLAVACGAAISIAVLTIAPSFGAFSVYVLPADVSKHLVLALDGRYAQDLVNLLAHGPGHISPHDAKGLIGFPSYHAALAVIVTWYVRELPVLRWLLLGVNAFVLVATPIQGGHHVIDVVAGIGVAALSVFLANAVVKFAARAPNRLIMDTQPATS